MRKNRLVRLTESDLHRIVRKSLNEFFFHQGGGSEMDDLSELQEINMDISKGFNKLERLINNPKYRSVQNQLSQLHRALDEAGDIYMDIMDSLNGEPDGAY